MNSKKTRFSLGWHPDLPDHRDKTLAGAMKKFANWQVKNGPMGGGKIGRAHV